MNGYCQWQGGDLILALKVQPRASRDAWGEVLGDRRKVRITAPPVDGKANAHLCHWLAKEFGVTQAGVRLLSGETGRDKRVLILAPARLPPGLIE